MLYKCTEAAFMATHLCTHECIAVTCSQMFKYGFEFIDTAYCGETKEQALALTSSCGKGQLGRGSSSHWWRKHSVVFCTTHMLGAHLLCYV